MRQVLGQGIASREGDRDGVSMEFLKNAVCDLDDTRLPHFDCSFGDAEEGAAIAIENGIAASIDTYMEV